jgi:hypothetical protein
MCMIQVQTIAAQSRTGFVNKLGYDFDVRSGGRILADETIASGNLLLPESPTELSGSDEKGESEEEGGNVQVNNPKQDYVQIFSGFRPFVRASESETSMAAFGRNIVVTYNDSTGVHVVPNPAGPGLITDRVRISAFGVSHDRGKTWKTGFMPPPGGGGETFGDPSVGVDRHGVFYFANLAADAQGRVGITVNKSVDGGSTWSNGVMAAVDSGSDKEWLAVGPDPKNRSRDNVYVTWTSFYPNGSCVMFFGRSIDGGANWIDKPVYAPAADPNPTHPQDCLQFTNPVVDTVTGILYIPFLHYSNAEQDFLQMLISDDAGDTFRFATFNAPGAPDPTVFPVTQPGELTECGAKPRGTSFAVNFRLTVHTALNAGGSVTGLPRYVQASRMTLQPAVAARRGAIYMAWSNSTSLIFGDPAGKSNILFMRSDDGGRTWSPPIQVNPDIPTDLHHVMPSLALGDDDQIHITYYTQHSDGTLNLDISNSENGGRTFPAKHTDHVSSVRFTLPPTNIPVPSGTNPFATTNYDSQFQPCYALGEYQSVVSTDGQTYAAWGDMRNKIKEPVNSLDPISGQTHSQEDVFFQRVE